jgi:hypothetical protein
MPANSGHQPSEMQNIAATPADLPTTTQSFIDKKL